MIIGKQILNKQAIPSLYPGGEVKKGSTSSRRRKKWYETHEAVSSSHQNDSPNVLSEASKEIHFEDKDPQLFEKTEEKTEETASAFQYSNMDFCEVRYVKVCTEEILLGVAHCEETNFENKETQFEQVDTQTQIDNEIDVVEAICNEKSSENHSIDLDIDYLDDDSLMEESHMDCGQPIEIEVNIFLWII